MGSFISTPVLPDIQTPTVLNFILQEMFQRADLVDIYSLADPKRCDRYIVAGSDALQKLFVKIRINPVKGPDGILFFQSIDGIIKGAPKNIKDKQRENCLELSFFFIRIFQIFGAVALSMFDNSIPMADPVYVSNKTVASKKGVYLQQGDFDADMISTKEQKPKGWFGTGGALRPTDKSFYIPDGPFRILNYYLSKPDAGYTSSDSMLFPGFSIMSLDQNTLYNITKSPGGEVTARTIKSNPTPIIKYTYVRDSNPYVLTAQLNIQGIDEYTVSLVNYAKDGTSVSGSTPSEVFKTFAGDVPISMGQAFPETKGKSLPTVLQAMFEKMGIKIFGEIPYSTVKLLRKLRYVSGAPDTDIIISGTHITIPGTQENKESPVIIFRDTMTLPSNNVSVSIYANLQIQEPIQDLSDGTYKYRVYIDFSKSRIKPPEATDYIRLSSHKTNNFIAFSKDGVPKSETSDLTIPAYLESVFQGIIKKSTNNSNGGIKLSRDGLPQPYNSEEIPTDLRIKNLWNALAKDPPIKSYCIARAVQLLSADAIRGNMSKKTYSSACSLSFAYQKDGSLPTPEEKLSDVYALHALATLFWTDLETKMPKIQDEGKYKNFLTFMKMNLEKYSSVDDTPEPPKMSSIVEKQGAVCEGKEGTRLEIPNDVSTRLQGVVKALVQQQIAHINSGMKVLELLFDMNSIIQKKVFALNPEILRGGMPEINRISGIARDVLMKYYSGCESTYNDGLSILYQADQQRPLVAVKADGTPATLTQPK